MNTPRSILGAREVCDRVGIVRSTLTRDVLNGRIVPLAKLAGPNGALLFDPAEVERYAAERKAHAA